jgi:DNA-binding NtrC family response regulator
MSQPRVLVVDDEMPVRVTLAANLELEGYDVVEAGDGKAALERVHEHEFDLVITDIRMPGMSGVELFHEIRRLRPTLPVVLMTAFAVEGLVQEALREGAHMVLQKPFAIEWAVKSLHNALHRRVILVVDDLPEVAETTAAALQALEVPARAVFSGEAALDAMRDDDIGVCVVDLVMPGMDGPQLIEKIDKEYPGVVFIAVTGFEIDELLRRAATHASAIMRKPVRPGELLEAIARARQAGAKGAKRA